MTIVVKTLTGKTIAIDAKPTDTVVSFQERIRDAEGIPPNQQRIIFNGKQLQSGPAPRRYIVHNGEYYYAEPQKDSGSGSPSPESASVPAPVHNRLSKAKTFLKAIATKTFRAKGKQTRDSVRSEAAGNDRGAYKDQEDLIQWGPEEPVVFQESKQPESKDEDVTFRGEEITLSDYNIKEQDIVHMVLRMIGS